MLVYDIEYAGEHESLCFLFAVCNNEDPTYIKHVIISEVNSRIVQVKEQFDNAGYGNYSAHVYYTSIINDYTRLLAALEYVYNINDIRDIDYMSVKTRTVHIKK